MDLAGTPGYQNRPVRRVTVRKALAGSEVDLLVMPIIPSHHLPACSSFPWCFPLPPHFKLEWGFHGFPRHSAPTLPQYIPTPASAAHPSLSFSFPATSKWCYTRACFPLPPAHSLPAAGLVFKAEHPPLLLGSALPSRSLLRMLPMHDAAEDTGRQESAKPHAECLNKPPWVLVPLGCTELGNNQAPRSLLLRSAAAEGPVGLILAAKPTPALRDRWLPRRQPEMGSKLGTGSTLWEWQWLRDTGQGVQALASPQE